MPGLHGSPGSNGSWMKMQSTLNTALEPEFYQPVELIQPPRLASSLVLSSPHSGRIYPDLFLAMSHLDPLTLRRSEDAYVDDLLMHTQDLGAPRVLANFPRAFLDVNREPYELDPKMFSERLPAHANTRSLRVAGGLGTIARIVSDGQEIYAQKLSVEAALHRIETLYRPYHAALSGLLHKARRAFGISVLVDCHSMPSVITTAGVAEPVKADFILGDRFGTSCSPMFTETAHATLRQLGYQVQRNKPYAGGFITEHYGHPASGQHALQIEANRALYMNEATLGKTAHFPRLARDMASVMAALSSAADDLRQRKAAAE